MGLALAVPPLLEVFSLARLNSLVRTGPATAALDDQALAAWVDRVLNALPWPWRKTCLRRAAVLYGLLRLAGRPVELWIGVKGGADVTAHAWLTLGDTPYLEADASHPGLHTPIARFPEGRPL